MQARLRGEVIAESAVTRNVHGYVYFPRESVKMERLRAAPKNESDLECPNGVQFYDVGDAQRAAWSYEKAKTEEITPIGGWVSFWGDVELSG